MEYSSQYEMSRIELKYKVYKYGGIWGKRLCYITQIKKCCTFVSRLLSLVYWIVLETPLMPPSGSHGD